MKIKIKEQDPTEQNGWAPDLPDGRDYKHEILFGSEFPEALPSEFEHENLPPTPYQDGVPKCCLATQSWIQAFNSLKEGIEFKGGDRYNFAKTGGWGGRTFRDTAQFLRNIGMPEYDLCPDDYSLSHDDYLDVSHFEENGLLENATVRKIKNFEFVQTVPELLKQAIFRMPIQVAVEIRNDTYDWNQTERVIRWSNKPTGVYHSIAFYGWNDKERYYLFANWWDKNNKHFQKLSYDYLIKAAMSFEDLPDLIKKLMWLGKLKNSSTIYLLNDFNMTAKPISSAEDYFNLTGDTEWKQYKIITDTELAKYKLENRILVFER